MISHLIENINTIFIRLYFSNSVFEFQWASEYKFWSHDFTDEKAIWKVLIGYRTKFKTICDKMT
jgi:hypothetical protein